MKKYIVSTHLGEFATTATSPQKAISNVRFRVYGRQPTDWHCKYWTVRECA